MKGQAIDTIRVVDNSASCAEMEILSKMVESLSQGSGSPMIKLHASDENYGFGKAINRAIKHDREECGGHEYYLLINNDAEASQEMVSKLLSLMEQEQDISLIAPVIVTEQGSIGRTWYNKIFGSTSPTKRGLDFPYLSGCCLFVRKNLIRRDVLFDESFFMYGEDVHLSWRAQKSGSGILCAEDVQVAHEGSGTARQASFFYEYHVARGHVLLALKTWERAYELPLFLLGRALFLAARAVIRSVRYRTLSPALAFILCWIPLKVRISKSTRP